MTCNCILVTEIAFEIKKNKENIVHAQKCVYVRDLSEISGGGGRVETDGGSQLFETQKTEGS